MSQSAGRFGAGHRAVKARCDARRSRSLRRLATRSERNDRAASSAGIGDGAIKAGGTSTNVLVAFASRHGGTHGIAARIAQTLEQHGLDVELRSVRDAGPLEGYDAFVVGSASYMGQWLKEARSFVRQHAVVLASHPVWLFSSGPIGPETIDAKGRNVLKASEPIEFKEFAEAVHPRDERVFFGKFDPHAQPIGLVERLGAPFMRMPAVRDALPGGDLRDWPEIVRWADGIARDLAN